MSRTTRKRKSLEDRISLLRQYITIHYETKRNRFTPLEQEIIELFQLGLSFEEIGNRVGFASITVRHWLFGKSADAKGSISARIKH